MYHFIVNPNSCCGNGYKTWKKIERLLMEEKILYEVYMAEQPGQAREMTDQLTRGTKGSLILVVVGRDGTWNEVVDGISFGGPITMGFIPAGAGSDLARSLKLPRSPVRCFRKIQSPKYHRVVDYGVMTYGEDAVYHRRFAVSAGIGMDAAACYSQTNSGGKTGFNWLGRFAYVMSGFWQLVKAKPVKGYLILDGARRVEFNHIFFVSAQIHPFAGRCFCLAPKADCSDGKLEVCVLAGASKQKALSAFWSALMGGRATVKGLRIFCCREVAVHVEKPRTVYVDGESCMFQQDIHLQCMEKMIRMIV